VDLGKKGQVLPEYPCEEMAVAVGSTTLSWSSGVDFCFVLFCFVVNLYIRQIEASATGSYRFGIDLF
jgi:hypothetical protein